MCYGELPEEERMKCPVCRVEMEEEERSAATVLLETDRSRSYRTWYGVTYLCPECNGLWHKSPTRPLLCIHVPTVAVDAALNSGTEWQDELANAEVTHLADIFDKEKSDDPDDDVEDEVTPTENR